jgi:hypothetical protein
MSTPEKKENDSELKKYCTVKIFLKICEKLKLKRKFVKGKATEGL